MTVKDAFDAGARDYDAGRRKLIPCFDDFYGVAISLLDFPTDAPIRVLDLGAGSGLLAAFVAARFPRARLTLVDLSGAMLAVARERFAALGRDADIVEADYARGLPEGRWDAVVSALSIHHLDHAAKRALFGRVAAVLEPGGLFVNAEQVLGETPAVEARHDAWWHREIRRLGAGEDEIAAALGRMRHDIMATATEQMEWMREAGLAEVCCPYRHHRFAVLAGQRAPQSVS
ncbi:MAG: methyltransferase domain-containing protein [Pseudomonadota bacterium]